MPHQYQPGSRATPWSDKPFSVVIKPAGPKCNLNCHYCYYLEKSQLFGDASQFTMSDEILKTFTRDYIRAHSKAGALTFLWHGGEPTLLGRAFFRKALAWQHHYRLPGMKISNAIQTNGTLLNQRWAVFLREHNFLVGLSIDGPRRLHDKYRETQKGAPTFNTVRRALRLLRSEDVEFNTLTVVHRANARHGREVYRFLRNEGVRFMQFIPLVERLGVEDHTPRKAPGMAPWSVSRQGYGRFMCAVFDEWMQRDIGSVFVRLFDIQLGLWSGMSSELCVFAETCGQDLAVEHNGDLYACDHYVTPSHRLGNIRDHPVENLVQSPRQQRFGEDKRDLLPNQCRQCKYLFACNGGCPKHRFTLAADGEATLNYLCPSYKLFFDFAGPALRQMADLLRQGLPPVLAPGILRNQSHNL